MTPIRTPGLTRRRFLTISAATLAAAGAPAGAAGSARWTGHAMGAPASMQLAGLPDAEARPIFRAVERELARLERIFSLYRADSQLVRLNEAGLLRAPAPELLEVLSLCASLHRATGGAFDPSLQPLWMLHARAAAQGVQVSEAEVKEARELVGWDGVAADAGEIRFARPGMALTLNGIAQGYVTDRIAALLQSAGLSDVLVDIGEIAAHGRRPDGDDWQAGIALPDGQLVARVTLRDRALATSAPQGTILDARSGLGHILDPRRPDRAPAHRLVSVSADRAAVADGLSTAGCLLTNGEISQALIAFPGARLETDI